jgi:Ca-activated chloride channel family protein
MNRTRRNFLIIVSLAVAGVVAMLYERLIDPPPPIKGETKQTLPPPPAGSVPVTIASSVTKQKWMEAVMAKFHTEGITTASGKKIAVRTTGVLSGGSMWKILDGRLKPVVWSPGAISWVDQFRERRVQEGKRPEITEACQPSVYSPIGWKTIVDLTGDPQGWARYGHPEWGNLKLGHPHPQYSSAGMLYLTSFAYGVTGKTAGLTAADIYSPAVEDGMRTLAGNTSKYGMISTNLLGMMARHGPQYLHAVSAFEEGTVRLNIERGDELRWPLVFIFPSEARFGAATLTASWTAPSGSMKNRPRRRRSSSITCGNASSRRWPLTICCARWTAASKSTLR